MTDFDFDAAWRELPSETRHRAVEILLAEIPEETWGEVREAIRADRETWFARYHMGWGMAVRNLLREHGLADADLPVTRTQRDYYGAGEGSGGAGWDDFYVQAVEAAAGERPIDPPIPGQLDIEGGEEPLEGD